MTEVKRIFKLCVNARKNLKGYIKHQLSQSFSQTVEQVAPGKEKFNQVFNDFYDIPEKRTTVCVRHIGDLYVICLKQVSLKHESS